VGQGEPRCGEDYPVVEDDVQVNDPWTSRSFCFSSHFSLYLLESVEEGVGGHEGVGAGYSVYEPGLGKSKGLAEEPRRALFHFYAESFHPLQGGEAVCQSGAHVGTQRDIDRCHASMLTVNG